jgi:REP element-mobilizing transposase RayT
MTKDTELYLNKYRVKSARAEWWDYSMNGVYFITICCKDMMPYFGNVTDGKMYLNKYGNIAHNCWENIPKHFPNAKLGEYIVMPNHIHGIIWVNTKNKRGQNYYQSFHRNRNQYL